jgi:hypothetical protein
MPFYFNYDELKILPSGILPFRGTGATVMSQNTLGTLVSTLDILIIKGFMPDTFG